MEIPIDIHIWQKDDYSGNYIDNVFNRTIMEDAMDIVKDIYTNISSPSDPIPGVTDYETTKIVFTLNSIFFNQNSTCWSKGNPNTPAHGEYLNSQANALHPSSSNNFKIHITGATPSWTGYGRFPIFNQDVEHYVVTYNKDHSPTFGTSIHVTSALAIHLAHEIGHNLDLYHTYSNNFNACDENDFDYLDDVFGSGINQTCPHDGGWGCDVNLSNNSCTNNILGGTSGATYISPKQVQRMHRAISLGSIRNYTKLFSFDELKEVEVNQDETWDFSIKLYNNLRVKTGNTLIIRCEVQFVPEAKIIVEQGAKLIIDGGTLTNEKYQNTYWQGIQVWGTTHENQFPQNNPEHQGMLVLKNGGTIENAHRAATNWNPDNWGEIGGVIQSDGGVFKNNRRDVAFMSYQNHVPNNPSQNFRDLSNFKNTDFITDDDFIEGYPQQGHVTMWEVHGINFSNCHFANNLTRDKSLSSSPNEGISTLDASFKVVAGCDDPILPIGQSCPTSKLLKSSFAGLQRAIQVAGAGTTETATISQTDFISNVAGVIVDEFNNVSINRNEFMIGDAGYVTTEYNQGIYLDNSTGFIVEENSVLGNLSFSNAHGITVNNSGAANNRLYKNSLHNIEIGTRADRRNSDGTRRRGLQFLCNEYMNNSKAIVVNYSPFLDGVRSYQGERSPKIAAGNTFQNNNLDIENNTKSIKYYYRGNHSQPYNFTGSINTMLADYENTCESSFTIGIVMEENFAPVLDSFNIVLDDLNTSYMNLYYNYISLIDDGNTEYMKDQIETNWSHNAWVLRENLMQKAPFLSEEAILTAAEQNVLPNAMLLEVLLANPDATKSVSFIDKLKR